MCNSTRSTLNLFAAALLIGGSLSAQTMTERQVVIGQTFGVNSINAPGSSYDISRDAATLRLSMYGLGSTPAVNNYGDTFTYANGSVRAGFLGRQYELLFASGSARSERRLVTGPGYWLNTFQPVTSVYLRVLGNTYRHSSSLSKSSSSPISFFSNTWFFMAGPVPITIYGSVRGTYSLSMNASVASLNRRTSLSSSLLTRAWGSCSGQVGIPGAGIGLQTDIELASPNHVSIWASAVPGTTNSMGKTLTAGTIGGAFRMWMYPIGIKLKAYVEFLWNRYSYTLLNWRLDSVISRSWSL